MTSAKRRKGNRSRLLAIRELEAEGWLVDVVEKTSKFAKQRDLFDIGDLLALKKGIIKIIQISTNKNHPHKKFLEFTEKYCCENILLEQWTYKDRKGFTKHEYTKW